MGSKRTMLAGGLGEIIGRNLNKNGRFVDLFTGSGSVACFVSENFETRVVATDLQTYATALAGAVIERDCGLDFDSWGPSWIAAAIYAAEKAAIGVQAAAVQNRLKIERIHAQAEKARALSAMCDSDFVRAYGGWYFSPWQALLLNALRQSIEPGSDWEKVALAAVIQTASRCVASPGHTAQPFKANTNAAPFLLESWLKDIIAHVTVCASNLCGRHAKVKGVAYTGDANEVAAKLNEWDVAFIDPPYSSVHYSRFYHVLESLARGVVGEVSGAGRYPSPESRPSSLYSIPTRAEDAFSNLLKGIEYSGATAIITFPASESSNRLSGQKIKKLASAKFNVVEDRFLSRFSTLGGDQKHRKARQDIEEMIITLRTR